MSTTPATELLDTGDDPVPPVVQRAAPGWLALAVAVALAAVVAAGVVAVRLSERAEPDTGGAPAAAVVTDAVMPSSAQVEATWGIRITGIQVAAARGLVLLRYQVLDEERSARLHAPDDSGIPEIWAEDADGHLATVMMNHRHYYGGGLVDGRTFALLYGNAHGIVSPGDLVTVRFPDGATLAHVTVLT